MVLERRYRWRPGLLGRVQGTPCWWRPPPLVTLPTWPVSAIGPVRAGAADHRRRARRARRAGHLRRLNHIVTRGVPQLHVHVVAADSRGTACAGFFGPRRALRQRSGVSGLTRRIAGAVGERLVLRRRRPPPGSPPSLVRGYPPRRGPTAVPRFALVNDGRAWCDVGGGSVVGRRGEPACPCR